MRMDENILPKSKSFESTLIVWICPYDIWIPIRNTRHFIIPITLSIRTGSARKKCVGEFHIVLRWLKNSVYAIVNPRDGYSNYPLPNQSVTLQLQFGDRMSKIVDSININCIHTIIKLNLTKQLRILDRLRGDVFVWKCKNLFIDFPKIVVLIIIRVWT